MAESFITNKRFFDNKNYPRGFSRSGDFTIKEAQILERFGQAFSELYLGKRGAKTEEEQQFIEFCKGDKEVTTENERIWNKYLKQISQPKRFHTLSGGKPQLDGTEDFIDSDD